MGAGILELAAKPQFDIGAVVDMGLQRRLQIGAVDDPNRARRRCSSRHRRSGRRMISRRHFAHSSG